MARLIKCSLLSIPVLLLLGLLLVSAWLHTWNSLTRESLIAELRFEPVAEKHFRALLATGDRCDVQPFEINGDQWRIDAHFIKWKYWASLLGLDAMYRLDRLEGRYSNITEQNLRHKLSHDLANDSAIDMVGVAEGLGRFNFLFDASYGSSTYHFIDTTRVYRVYRTQTGIITRSEALPAPADNGGILSIEISLACDHDPGIWRRASAWLDDTLRGWR